MDALLFLQLNNQIFGICPCCGEFFRLSECNLFQGEEPEQDWLNSLTSKKADIDAEAVELTNRKSLVREEANTLGRIRANEEIKDIDTVFHPNNLSADDAKTIFHPVDFIVFNGMNDTKSRFIENLVFLDGPKETTEARSIQRSIADTIANGEYEWIVLRVDKHGAVRELAYNDADYTDDLRLPSFGQMPESDRQKYGSRPRPDHSNHDFRRGLP
jgi:predicted Holliday junction resolvase-like endonuclease